MIILWTKIIRLKKLMILKKTHKKKLNRLSHSNHLLKTGFYGFKILSDLQLTEKQAMSLERILKVKLKKLSIQFQKTKVWVNIQLNKTLTKLSLESRMGKGKGSIYTKVLFIEKGSIIYEFKNIKIQQLKEIYMFFKKHIPCKLVLVCKK